MKDKVEGIFALLWCVSGLLAFLGGLIHSDYTALAIIFLTITIAFKEA